MRILLAVDGSQASQAAVRTVTDRPWPEGSTVRVLTVAERTYPPPGTPWDVVSGASGLGVRSVHEQELKRAEELAAHTASSLENTGLNVEADAGLGDPREVIVERAAEWGPDLIVLGSHGRTGLKRWVLGSVAEAVVRHAPCSVEVARFHEENGAQPSEA